MTRSHSVHLVGAGIVGRGLRRLLHDRQVVDHGSAPRFPPRGGVPACRGDVVVLAHGGDHAAIVPDLLAHGLHVVTVGDSIDDTRALLDLDGVAARGGVTLVIGAALSPGLSGLIARHLAGQLDTVDEIHIAVHGTAGPACARAHHRTLSGWAPGWHDDAWTDYVGGSGRELCWFPEPVGSMDCYRARMADPVLLHRTFPEADRISARRSATRRDRLTARLPMLAPPHHEGGIGALRVELRGALASGARECLIAGVAELVGTAAAATAAAFTVLTLDGCLPRGAVVAGDARLPNLALLDRVQSFGIRLQEFTGIPQQVGGT